MSKVVIYQIYYEKSQLKNLDYTPLYNPNCTYFFESQVMADTPIPECDYFGIVGPNLRAKIDVSKTWRASYIANTSVTNFSPETFEEELLKKMPDIMSFGRHAPHNPVAFADRFHPNFSKYFKAVLRAIGKENAKITHYEKIIYWNYFVAKPEIYKEYVDEWLIPAINAMIEMPDLMQNSGYPKKLPETLQKKWGIAHYPYHPFICERLISVFINQKNYKFLNY